MSISISVLARRGAEDTYSVQGRGAHRARYVYAQVMGSSVPYQYLPYNQVHMFTRSPRAVIFITYSSTDGLHASDRATSDDLPQSDHNCDGGRLQLALEATIAVLIFLTQPRLDQSEIIKSMATRSHILEHSVESDIVTTPRFGLVLS